jgi:hypothetical protein
MRQAHSHETTAIVAFRSEKVRPPPTSDAPHPNLCSSALFSRRDLVGIDRLHAGSSNVEDNDLLPSNDENGPEFPLRTKPEKKVS